jgi:signal peptide peptidase SppA
VDEPWDAGTEIGNIPNTATASTLRRMYAWVDPTADPDLKGSYKLPHHKVVNGSPAAANVNGVRAALSRLPQQATQIPTADVPAVRAHLTKHLDKFNGQKAELVLSPAAELVMVDAELMLLQCAGRTWAIRRELAYAIRDSTLAGAVPSMARMARPGATSQGSIAVIPLKGMIMPEATGLMALLMGGGGLAQFSQDLRAATADPDVKHIVMDVDSPGGFVDMVPEVAQQIRQARQAKPIVAVANTTAASAAYWLASQAHEVVVTPSGEVGAIGVYQLHRDLSGAMEQQGIKPTLISAGKYKVEGNPYEALSDDARAAAQTAVDDHYDMFTADVALGRGVDQQNVKDGYGEGRTLTAKRAVRAGLADRVATLGETVSRLQSGRAKVRRTEPTAADVDEYVRSRVEVLDEASVDWSDPLAASRFVDAAERKRLLDLLASR